MWADILPSYIGGGIGNELPQTAKEFFMKKNLRVTGC
jgi:hypothetical protein